MKVLHVITRLDHGGAAKNTLCTCRELAREFETVLVHGLSHESHLTAAEEARLAVDRAEAAARGVRFIAVETLVRRIAPLRDLRAFLALWRIFRRERPDVVHTHTSKAGMLGRAAARLCRVRHVVHTPHGHVFHGHFGRPASILFLLLERAARPFTDRLVALTEGEKRDYLARSVARRGAIEVVPSGVDLARYAPRPGDRRAARRALGLDPEAELVGFAGWLSAVKGVRELLEAMPAVWREFPKCGLVLLGRGELEEELRARSAQIDGKGRVRFLGWRDDLPRILPLLDLFVLPSRNEGMGRVLVEAMACGVPVLAAAVCGIPDLVQDGRTGILFAPGDVEALAGGIRRLLRDRDLAARLAARGLAHCRRYDLAVMVDQLRRLYLALASRPGTSSEVPAIPAPPFAGVRPLRP
ncbi:MAG: glycosyltransferase family 4 protein [Desulfobacterales bacterium]